MGAVIGLLGDLFSIGSSIIGGNSSKNASRNAQAAQISGLNNAVGSINSGQNAIDAAFAPYSQSGVGAQNGINALLGIPGVGTAGGVDWAGFVNSDPWRVSDWKTNHSDKTIDEYGQYNYDYDLQRGRAGDPNYAGFDLAQFQSDPAGDQQMAISQLQQSPLYQSLYRTGQEAVLQNGSATGGLRGGNIQSSLANFGSDTLTKVIQQQLANLGGVAGNGLQAAGAQAGAQGNTSAQIAQLMSQIGDTNAGGILQRGAINANTINGVAKGLGSLTDGGGIGKIIGGIGKLF